MPAASAVVGDCAPKEAMHGLVMTFIHITSNRDFVKFYTARWVEGGIQDALQRLDDHQIDREGIAREIGRELTAIAKACLGPINRPLAERTCRSLGATLSLQFSDIVPDEGFDEADLLLRETIEDIDGTIDAWLAMQGPEVAGIRRMAKVVSGHRIKKIAACEHYGDLLILAGSIAAHVAISENP